MGDSVHQACARGVRWGGEGAEGAGGRGVGRDGGGKVEGEGWTNLCATASGLPFGGSSPLEAQVEWLLLKLSSKTPKHLDIGRWTCQVKAVLCRHTEQQIWKLYHAKQTSPSSA